MPRVSAFILIGRPLRDAITGFRRQTLELDGLVAGNGPVVIAQNPLSAHGPRAGEAVAPQYRSCDRTSDVNDGSDLQERHTRSGAVSPPSSASPSLACPHTDDDRSGSRPVWSSA